MWPRCVGPGKQKRYRRVPVSHQVVFVNTNQLSSGSHVISAQLHSTCVCWQRSLLEAAHMCAVALRALVKLGQRKSPWPRVLPPEHSDS